MGEAAHEHHTVLERKELSAKQVHAALRLEGEEELKRATLALFWSSIACGLTLGLAFIARGVLHHHLPDASWRPLVVSLGYAVGFIGVELGRQELYTGNTLTALLPFLHDRQPSTAVQVLRVWVVVLIGNLVGAAFLALAVAWTTAFDGPVHGAFAELGRHAVSHDIDTAFVKGIFGGWMIALMIWLMPGAHHARIWVILIITWLLAASELTHVVGGAAEVLYAVFTGGVSLWTFFEKHLVPVLLGNTVGGVVFVALLNHLQIASGGSSKS